MLLLESRMNIDRGFYRSDLNNYHLVHNLRTEGFAAVKYYTVSIQTWNS